MDFGGAGALLLGGCLVTEVMRGAPSGTDSQSLTC